MDEMREIITIEQANKLFLMLAFLLPVLGAGIGAALGSRHSNVKQGAISGLLIGLLGTLNYVLWNVYNLITNSLGLDTVKNVVVNLILFVLLGAAMGGIAGYLWRNKGMSDGGAVDISEPPLVPVGGTNQMEEETPRDA